MLIVSCLHWRPHQLPLYHQQLPLYNIQTCNFFTLWYKQLQILVIQSLLYITSTILEQIVCIVTNTQYTKHLLQTTVTFLNSLKQIWLSINNLQKKSWFNFHAIAFTVTFQNKKKRRTDHDNQNVVTLDWSSGTVGGPPKWLNNWTIFCSVLYINKQNNFRLGTEESKTLQKFLPFWCTLSGIHQLSATNKP